MEGIVLLVLIILLILLITTRSKVISDTRYIAGRLDELHRKVERLSKGEIVADEPKGVVSEEIGVALPSVKPQVTPEPEPEPIPEPTPVEVPAPLQPEPVVAAAPAMEEVSAMNAPPRKSFFERNPDLEKFIGENLANKIGIGILVIGIGFFVKYAIDQDWINEIGRVFIGVLAGGILLGVAHKLRKSLEAFSSVLVGGGIAVLYLTIAIAFHEYALFSQTIAFLIMVVITGFAVLFSIGYDRRELAVLSILGGFASPFMVSTGEGNYIVLFTYILILDVGMLVLAYYKKWNIVNIVSYAFTVILFGSWLTARYDYLQPGMIGGSMIFGTLFYLVFFAMNIVNNLKERVAFGALEFGILLSNTFLYYGAGMFILNNDSGMELRGLFTVALGVFNFVFAYVLYRNSRIDRNLVFLLIGLVLTFISLAAPVQLKGNYITLFWAAEAVLLLWLSQKSGIKLMKLTSVVVTGLMVISLAMDWNQIYGYGYAMEEPLRILFNKGYVTGLVVVASMVLTLRLLRNEITEYLEEVRIYKVALTFASILGVYLVNLLELRYQAGYFFPDSYDTQTMLIGSYNMLFILLLVVGERRIGLPDIAKRAFAFWGVAAILLYIGAYHAAVVSVRMDYVLTGINGLAFLFHYILVGLLVTTVSLTISRLRQLTEFNEKTGNAYSWVYVAFFVFIASSELETVVLLIARPVIDYSHVLTQTHKIGFPILWGLSSFLIIAVGLKWKRKQLRIISLTLFLVTLLKLFIWDIRGISEGGKIAAFISLGVLLLVVSFMYQRLKKLLLADDANAAQKPVTE
jgi:uncharacterized membrane protein